MHYMYILHRYMHVHMCITYMYMYMYLLNTTMIYIHTCTLAGMVELT